MKALLYLLAVIVILCPVSSEACDLCSKLESSTCISPNNCFPDDYYRQLDKAITYCFIAGPTFKLRFNEAVAEWTSAASISMSEVTSGQEMDVWWCAVTAPSDRYAKTFTTRYPSTGDFLAYRIEIYNLIESATTGNPLTWVWSNTCSIALDEVNLWHVLAHELGHAIGFCIKDITDHPFTGSVMTRPDDVECYDALQATDILCAHFLYQADPRSRCAEFTPVLHGNGVSIKWQTEYEYETGHFLLEKQQLDGSFAAIGEPIMSVGSDHAGAEYEFFDPTGTRSDTYRLMEVDRNGIVRGTAQERVLLEEPSGSALLVLSEAERAGLHKDIDAMLEAQTAGNEKPPMAAMGGGIEWLAIYPAAFSDAISPLITYRDLHGYHASGVTYEYIQSHYGTIKAYLQNLWSSQGQALKYVVIVGDDDRISAERCTDGDVGDYYANYLTDIITVDLAGDWRPELSVGRIPAASADEVSLYVAKTLEYEGQEAADWNNHITFFVDDRDGGFGYQSGPVASRYAQGLIDFIPPWRTLHYENMLAHLPYDQCSQRSHAISEFDAGRGTVLAFGSTASKYSLVGWLRTYDIYEECAFSGSQLAQNHKYAFVLGASCDIGDMNSIV
jgi:hypothetical protein